MQSSTALSRDTIIRAWRERDFLESLSPEERMHLPENPAGSVTLKPIRPSFAWTDEVNCGTNCSICTAEGCGTSGCTHICYQA